MRLISRLLGTWLIGIALILLIIDGTRSLAANSIVMMSLAQSWQVIHAPSLAEVQTFLGSRFFGPMLQPVWTTMLALPAWAVLGVPGVFLAYLGRTRRSRVFVKQDQI